ncbi:SpoIIE family protein phosphatase [Streptomyces sp. NBC_01210]|uniref:SpoIIE family protein phosphatase n=1 Tax=Streptomyces sp. NBC_01210 TaxID=2903774 RepID=UPI002E12CB94|nr:SpoIIE family protein phosphatase [Streptomyces sp. NBC_01210]
MSSSDTRSSTHPFGTTSAEGAAERDDVLTDAVLKAVEVTGAHAGSVFLISRNRHTLVLAAAAGMPPSLLGGWRRIPVNSPIPVAEAFRSRRTVHLVDADETMRRFPQLAVALPYPFGSASVPVTAGQETFGSMAVVWAARADGKGLSKSQRRQLRTAAGRLGVSLAELTARGADVGCDMETVPVEVPVPSASALRVGLFDWNLDTGALEADATLCAIFGLAPDEYDGRAATLAAQVHLADRPGFRAAARTAVEEGRVLARDMRVPEKGGGHRTIGLWGRVPGTAAGREARPHLVGGVLDLGAGTAAVAAIERLTDGFFSLDREGRVTYANHTLVRLLRVRREDLVGRRPWDVLPWLADPAYEDRFRAARVSQQPVSFLAQSPDQWLVFSLRPDAQGMTGWAAPAGQPVPAEAEPGAPPAEPGGAAPSSSRPAPTRLGAIYRVLQMSSALTEAVTAREVCDVVADQLLPAVGGHRLAIYVVHEGHLRLLSQRGYRESFLERFEGRSLHHGRGPLTGALTSGAPLFIESREEFLRAYPELHAESSSIVFLPLIASSRPVGACILGFDEAHRFSDEERSLLTALSGLIAQALERARLYDAEFTLARGLQNALLPHRLPTLPGIRVTGRYLPGTRGMDIGGDWYDVIPTDRGVVLVVGDVEGHNVAAAATMGQLRSAVRAFASAGHRPSDVIASTNRLLLDLDPGLLASCCYVLLDPGPGVARVVRAGHCPPLLRRPDGHTEILDLPGGPLLGVERAADYPESELTLLPGSVLALYTDGLIESRESDIGVGLDRLRTSLAHAGAGSLEELADALLRDARQSPNRMDDIALLLTMYTHTSRPTPPAG